MAGESFDQDFFDALKSEDELGLVLRAHIHIEKKLTEFLEVMAERAHLEKMTLDYSQKVHLAVALGLKTDHAQGLYALGSIRNVFAHKLDSSLTDERLKNFYKALGPSEKDTVQKAYEKTEQNLKQYGGKNFGELPPRNRFILIAVALQAVLELATRELKARVIYQMDKGGSVN